MAFVKRINGDVVEVSAVKQKSLTKLSVETEQNDLVLDDKGSPVFEINDKEWTLEVGSVSELSSVYFPSDD